MHRILVILALFASTMATAKKAPEPKQFLDKSVIAFPNSIGDYVLAETRYEPEHWSHRVTSLWTVNAAPASPRRSADLWSNCPACHLAEVRSNCAQISPRSHHERA